ncbi:MAG: hypothetical protein IPG09_14615 [Ignavibacteria bacterium]|nr:hypothetical protein [Ignavibacteria bacterium]
MQQEDLETGKYEGGIVTEDELVVTRLKYILSDLISRTGVCLLCKTGIVYRFNKSDLVGVNNNLNIVPENFSLIGIIRIL